MLIVSQNKEKIVNIDNCVDIFLGKEYGQDEEIDIVKYVSIAYKGPYRGGLLGYYKTEERAKEVLQEIVQAYVDSKKSKEAQKVFGYSVIPSNTYYEMPEE